MSFVTPWFLLGGLVLAVPILLHLIRRESAQKIEFPTLMFLRKVSKRTIRYQKLRHLLLFLLRLLALLLLVFAFMRPFVNRPQASAAPGGRATVAHVIMLDNSMSMDYGDRWARAREAAARIARGAQPGDKVSLLEFSDRTNVLTLPATDFGVVLDLINNSTEITDRPTRYGQALKIAEKAALDSGADKRIIHLISDFQKSGWAADEQDFRLSSQVELQCTDVGSDQYSNLSIGDIQLVENDEEKGGGLKIRFSIFNFGTENRSGTRVTMSVDGRAVAEKRVDTARGAVQGMEFDLPGLTSGVHNVALEVDDPRLTRDNRFSMTLQERTKIPVVSVEIPNSGRGGRAPSFFLSNALNISALSPYRLSAITPQQFASMGAVTGGLLIWNNTPGGGADMQKKLQDFVRGGGGLMIVLADFALAADFTRTFGTWLPLKIKEVPANSRHNPDASLTESFTLLTDLRMDHPIFHPFSEPHSGTFSSARFFDHARLQVAAGAQVLARFDDGDPALVAADVDKGRVLVFASSADDETNDLPVHAIYTPFWHQILRYLENYRQERQWMDVGDTMAPRKLLVEAAVRQGKRDVNLNQAIVVMDPAKHRVDVAAGSDALALDRAGFYEIRTAGLNASVAANPSLRESDLSHGNVEEMAAGWVSLDSKAQTYIPNDEGLTAEEQDRRARLWRYLLFAVLALLIVEGLLANRFILKPE
ncbi:MAG: BatA domain-containing protein [Acidobacteriota bacterium]|jgi:hypothetical protein